jgi:hypothetical protein
VNQLATKRRRALSLLVQASGAADEGFDINHHSLQQSFDGWCARLKTGVQGCPDLITEDYIEVQLVTLREGFVHNLWPPGTVEKFMNAEVIKPESSSPRQSDE